MDLAMTIGTASVKVKIRFCPMPQPVTCCCDTRCIVADQYFKQPLINRAMWIMAVRTIVEDRRMYPKKGASPLRMASVTIFVHTGLYEL